LDWFVDPNGNVLADFIGRFEHLDEDWAFVTQKLGIVEHRGAFAQRERRIHLGNGVFRFDNGGELLPFSPAFVSRNRSPDLAGPAGTLSILFLAETEELSNRRLRGQPYCRFKFDKRGQLFIRVHNETLSVIAMRVRNPDCSPFGDSKSLAKAASLVSNE
jgi:hypothetical protein